MAEGVPTAPDEIQLSTSGVFTISGTVTNGSAATNGADVIAWNSTAKNGHAVSNATGYYGILQGKRKRHVEPQNDVK